MSEKYDELCKEAFGASARRNPGWFHFPFPFESAAGQELLKVAWKYDILNWRGFLQNIRDEKVPGALVEFGVFEGNALSKHIGFCDELGLSMNIHGFDSFDGLPEPSKFDLTRLWQAGKFKTNFDKVKTRVGVGKRKNVFLHRGWFCDTLADPKVQAAIPEVAFARIDCDLYDSTMDCLRFLEGRLAHGAYLHFDDWTHDETTGETKAFFEWLPGVESRYRFEHITSIAFGSCTFRVWWR